MTERRRFRGVAIALVLRMLSWLPLRVVHGIGASVGWLLWALHVMPCRVAARNIAASLPELDANARARLLKACMVENGKAMAELAPIWLWPTNRVLRLMDDADTIETLEQAHARGKGLLVIAPHHGAWEIAGLSISRRMPMTIMFAPGRHGIDALVRSARERAGSRLVPTNRHGVMAVTRWLEEGGVTGILPDQDPGPGSGVFVPFFGVAAKTTTLPAKLAQRTGAAAFIVWAERLPGSRGYRLRHLQLPPGFGDGPLDASVAAMNAAVEQALRDRLEQYLWTYKRFRTRPEGEPDFYTR